MKVQKKHKINSLGIIFLLFLALLVFSNSNTQAQLERPYSDCYQQLMNLCSDCTEISRDTRTFTYMGCDVQVSYKIKTCICPIQKPTTFVDIEYLRIDPFDPNCTSLLSQLYPPNGVYNPANLNLAAYKQLSRNMYDQLTLDLFKDVQNNYMYPDELKFQVFWPASCNAVCQITVIEDSTMLILQTKPCNADICCGIEYTYSYNGNNNYNITIDQTYGEVQCYLPFGVSCDYSYNDEIVLPEGTYHVLDAVISACTSFCDNPN